MFCYFLFSNSHFVLRASSSDDLTCKGVTSRLISLFISWLLCLLHKQRQGLQMCGYILSCFAPLDDLGDRTNQLHWLKFLYTLYISLLNQAGKGRVFYSVDKCFETGADPRNIFDKQILKGWTPCLSTFYCVISRATLA